MLILPVINKGKIFNAELKLVHCKKLDKNIANTFDSAKESDVIINGKSLRDSNWDKKDIMSFVKGNSLNQPRDFYVNTKNEQFNEKRYDIIGNRLQEKDTYETYKIANPYKLTSFNFEKLYDVMLLDIINKVPNKQNNGRYVSLKELGFDEVVNDQSIEQLENITNSVRDTSKWDPLFREYKIEDLVKYIDFFSLFEATVIPHSTVPKDEVENIVDKLSTIKTRDYKNLNKYYKIAKENTEIYKNLNKASNLLYGKPFRFVQSKKQRAKRIELNKSSTSYQDSEEVA